MFKAIKKNITKYYKWGSPNVTLVGSPTISNGVVSGFSTSKYLRTQNVVFQSNWEVCVKFTTGSDVTTLAWVVGGGGSQNRLIIGYEKSKFRIILSSNNTSANLANISGSYTVKTNTTYWLKVQFTGTQYVMSYSTDGKTFTTDYTLTSSTKLYEDGKPLSLGANQYSNGVNGAMATGSIDLKECYIKQNGNITWRGMTTVAGSASDYVFSEQRLSYFNIKQNGKYLAYKGE
jgi:hypothetical protein